MADTDKTETALPPEPHKPRGRTSLWTKLLIVFNLLATLGFGAALYVDLGKRQAWNKAVFLRDLAVLGLPIDEKDSNFSTNPEAGTHPKYDLDPPLIKDAYKARGGKLTDKFMEVRENFQDPLKVPIRHADLDQDILAKHFSDAGAGLPVVSTVREEIKRLKDKLPGEIDAVAQDVAAKAKGKSAEEKHILLQKILFPLCTEGWQVVKLDQKIRENRNAKQDEEFLAAAAKRRLWFDILQPLEVFRPSAQADPTEREKAVAADKPAPDAKVEKALVDRAADLEDVSLEALKKHFVKRCDDALADEHWINRTIKRDNSEKRRSAAFLLVDVSQVEIPGAERVAQKQPNARPPKGPPKLQDKKVEAEGEGEEGKKVDEQPAPKDEVNRPERQLAFPKAERRAEAVCGLRDFDQACEDLAIVTDILAKQTVQAVQRDLGTFHYPVGDANALGFLGKYDMALQRLEELAMLVGRRERQYQEMTNAHDERAKLLEDRTVQEKDAIAKLLEARNQTRQLAHDLKTLQDELFIAQLNLRGAHEYIQYLVERLAEAEKKYLKSKGGPGQ